MRLAATALLLLALAVVAPAAAAADSWHAEQPVPAGAGEVAEPLGQVGDVEFWSPNRGVLITAGEGGMPAGVYAYDGTGWHLYSTVCGGHEGRIAWAGPSEFWTISDQSAGQERVLGETQPFQFWNRSLCHFKDGRVVASYAEPIGQEGSYPRMSAAACSGPSDCWFGGERLPGTTNVGAFHLHWDGQTLSAVPSLTEHQPATEDPARAVAGLDFFAGHLYESVQVGKNDGTVPGEPGPLGQPSFLHAIEPNAPNPFVQLFTEAPLSFGSSQPSSLSAFRFAPNGERLWAVAGTSGEGGSAAVTLVRRTDSGGFAQVPLKPNSVLASGDAVLGAAAEPGSDRIWISLRHGEGEGGAPLPARLAAILPDGTVEPATTLPAESESIGHKGSAGPIACPAAGQCWMATEKGWLFHLGGSLPQDTDPAMHTLISFRPPDHSIPVIPPAELPLDDSGSELPPPPLGEEILRERLPRRKKVKALVARVRRKVIGGNVLELSFVLHARAHVQLLAKRHRSVVARTPRRTLGKGRHDLRLRLDPDRWPTSLDFQVHRAR